MSGDKVDKEPAANAFANHNDEELDAVANAFAAYDEEPDAITNAFANNDEVPAAANALANQVVELAATIALAATKDTHIVPKTVNKKFALKKENTKDTHIVPVTINKKFALKKENTKDTHIVP